LAACSLPYRAQAVPHLSHENTPMHRPLPRGPRGSTILEAAVVLVMLGLLSAIAVPRFLSSRARAHQAEARSTLKSWYLTQRSHYEEKAYYAEDLRQLGFTVERGNRYAYYFGRSTSCEIRDTEVVPPPPPRRMVTCVAVDRYAHGMNTPALPLWWPFTFEVLGITHTGEGLAPANPGLSYAGPPDPRMNISALAVGDIDDDVLGVDTWYVSSADASASLECGDSKKHLEAGTPLNYFDDVAHENFVGCR
jgi:type IV pilus assembly protein PilA